MNQDQSRPTCQRRLRLILWRVLLASFVLGGSAFAAAPKPNVIQPVRAGDIASLERQQLSAMPEGLEQLLTRDQFRDLLAYLQSLK